VRILNGAHSLLVPVAFLCGMNTVREAVEDPLIRTYLQKAIFQEVLTTLDLPGMDLTAYARTVLERFANPSLKHQLLAISLNATSKFRVRVLPSFLEYVKREGALPPALTFSLAALIFFYRGTERRGRTLQGMRTGIPYAIDDDREVLDFFADQWQSFARTGDRDKLVGRTLSRAALWGRDLTTVSGLAEAVGDHVAAILADGMAARLAEVAR
jgi:tagaturonate reductase